MGILDIFRKRKNNEPSNINEENPGDTVIPSKERQKEILDNEIETFFPKEDGWNPFWEIKDFKKYPQNEENVVCHLSDNHWMAQRMHQNLLKKGFLIRTTEIEEHIVTSKRFVELKNNYELELVKLYIEAKVRLLDYDYAFKRINVQNDFPNAVIKVLSSMSFEREIIEEGIEKNVSLWLQQCITKSFENEFGYLDYPSKYHGLCRPQPASEEHLQNYIAASEYQYYKEHKDSVDKYGELTPNMQLTEDEYLKLEKTLKKQSAIRHASLDYFYKTEKHGLPMKFIVDNPELFEPEPGE